MRVKLFSGNVLVVMVLLTVELLLSSCATTNSKIAFHEEQFQEKDESIIYIYRRKSVVGAAVRWVVRLDNTNVAMLSQNAYVALHTPPGPHTITIGDAPVSFSTLMMGGALPAALDSGTAALDRKAREKGTFVTGANEIYFIRSEGFNVSLVAKERALREISRMKYDTGLRQSTP